MQTAPIARKASLRTLYHNISAARMDCRSPCGAGADLLLLLNRCCFFDRS